MVADYRGQLVGKQRDTNGSTLVSVSQYEALSIPRSAQVTRWMKDVQVGLAQVIGKSQSSEEPLSERSRPNVLITEHVIDDSGLMPGVDHKK
jgi:hypothetical protein